MLFAPLTEEQRKLIFKDHNYDENQIKNKVEQVKEWWKKQPHLPQVSDDFATKMITKNLLGTKMSTEITKYKIDTYYTFRSQIPEVLMKRDPTSQEVKDSVETIITYTVSELTPEGYRVDIVCYPNKFPIQHIVGMCRRVACNHDLRFMLGEHSTGLYIIQDCKGLSFSVLAEAPWPTVLKFITYLQEALPVQVKAIFFINAPSFMETILNILKPALKEKIRNRIQVFSGDHTNLYKFIPRRILPSDYGGDAPSLEESNRAWQKAIESYRDYFIAEEKQVTDESKRPKESKTKFGQVFGVNGTFNKLDID